MAALEVLTIDPAAAEAARLTVPQTGDHYDLPRRAEMAFETLTGSAADAALDISGTWNTTGTPTALKLNVTDTASNAASNLMDLQVGGSSSFIAGKSNDIFLRTRSGIRLHAVSTSTFDVYVSGTIQVGRWAQSRFSVSGEIGIGPSGNNPDVFMSRDAANTLALRNSTNAQEQRTYGTYTDGSNYRRLTLKMSTSGVAEIKPEGAGTGASGNVIHLSGLPTSNPGPGILWNNGGTPAIGT